MGIATFTLPIGLWGAFCSFETGFDEQGVWPSHYETKQESLANEHTLDNPPFYSFEIRVKKN